jgi:hypothetical protein
MQRGCMDFSGRALSDACGSASFCVNTNAVILAKARIQVVIGAEGHNSRCFASVNNLGSSLRWNDGCGKASVLRAP